MFLAGLLVGATLVFVSTGLGKNDLPKESSVTGTVGTLNSDRTAFSFVTDEGGQTGFSIAPDGAESIKPGADLTLVIVEGDGYQVVASATPT
jgi:hypothetical protein